MGVTVCVCFSRFRSFAVSEGGGEEVVRLVRLKRLALAIKGLLAVPAFLKTRHWGDGGGQCVRRVC